MNSILINLLTLVALPRLLLVSMFRKTTAENRRVLVIQLGKIGDLMCTTPLFRSLHEHGDKVTVLCNQNSAPVLLHNPCVERVIFHDSDEHRGLKGRWTLLQKLHFERFDVSIAVLPGTLNAVYGLWTSAPLRVHTRGGRMGLLGLFFHRFNFVRLKYTRGTRTFDHYMTIAKAVGAAPVPYRHEIHLTDEEKQKGDLWLTGHGIGDEPFVVFSLTAGNALKEWPVSRFIDTAAYAWHQHQFRALFSSSAVWVTSDITRKFGTGRGVDGGGLNLRMLAAVIRRAKAFVSVDTGPLYIAHALGVPVVDIVGPVDPNEQPPIPGPKVQIVLPDPPVAPSSFVAETLRVENEEQRKAVENTSVKAVCDAMEKILIAS